MQEEETRANIYLSDLVSAWERHQAAKEELNKFLFEEASEPHMPERFESVEELIQYNQQRAAYEHERSKFIQQRKAFEEQYNEATGAVTTILPVGTTVSFRVPEDLGRVSGYGGNQYDISFKETEEGPRISVTKRPAETLGASLPLGTGPALCELRRTPSVRSSWKRPFHALRWIG